MAKEKRIHKKNGSQFIGRQIKNGDTMASFSLKSKSNLYSIKYPLFFGSPFKVSKAADKRDFNFFFLT
jgi:hypothetical protein